MSKDKNTYGALYGIGVLLMVAGVLGHIINYAINGVHGFKTFVTSDQLSVTSDHIQYYVANGPKKWIEISSFAYHATYVTICIFLLGVASFLIAKNKEVLKSKIVGLINKFM
jgi:hypothetical protein